ncbi:pimeloyl-ACP methyl ester carboxylesterase [Lysobacter niastensis]|uniref:Pimeloyl-ACP methyl ester carboxylesterase n=1 Tax=Lysobacter niastensis TaxID=380629 RepID=A0ABU1W9Y1_9GAMM|nr:alpha/beta hydrolase [Lysobacter niastensis]MDR7134374.1 pimeloyl-ACP methyl ester carboxylesterase [Lysobacter niastensis]
MNAMLIAPLVLAAAAAASPVHASTTAATAQNQYVQVNGNKIAYRSIGSGSPIVLANRMRGTLDTWDPLFLDKLAERHTVITFDYPGVGYSTGTLPDDLGKVASFVNDFTTAIKLDKFAMLGWSWGGFTTQTLLLDKPERVTHAILVGTNPPGPGQIPIQQVFIERAMKPVNDLDDEEVLFFDPKSEFSRSAAKASRDRIYARPGVVSTIPSKLEQFQVYLKAAEVFGEDKLERRAKLTQSRTPMLVISGDHDASTAGQNWFPLIGQIPNAQFVFYPESGHGPQHQYPELSAEYVADFIARTSK